MKLLYFDIETTSLDPFLPDSNSKLEPRVICIGYSDGKDVIVLPPDKSEVEQLNAFLNVLSSEKWDALVTYNGDKFDVPYLAGRMIKNSLDPSPLFMIKHVDLFWIIKKYLRKSARSNLSLHSTASMLGISYSDEFVGSDVATLYKQGKYDDIVSHCREDVRLTVEIAKVFEPLIRVDLQKRYDWVEEDEG
ncbi:MAG: hypothetical protein DRJ18_00270 [Candidatus Methanomethylicota archaeon]|nr:MAG: hypothetical protein DRJ18_00270 [Candidatus Verstraetearchaeota archaeon]